MYGAKNVHSGMPPPEIKNVVVKKESKTADKTEGKVDKVPEKKVKKEEKAGEKKNTGGEASKGGNREDVKNGEKPPAAAGAVAAENLGMGNGGETAEEEMAGNTGKNEDKRNERGQSEKVNRGKSSGQRKENNQDKKCGEKENMDEPEGGGEEAGDRVNYNVEQTVIVSVDGKLTMMDLLLGIKKQCGVILGCRMK